MAGPYLANRPPYQHDDNVFDKIWSAIKEDDELQAIWNADPPGTRSPEDRAKDENAWGGPGSVGGAAANAINTWRNFGAWLAAPLTQTLPAAYLAGADTFGAVTGEPGLAHAAKEFGEFLSTDAGMPGLLHGMPGPSAIKPGVSLLADDVKAAAKEGLQNVAEPGRAPNVAVPGGAGPLPPIAKASPAYRPKPPLPQPTGDALIREEALLRKANQYRQLIYQRAQVVGPRLASSDPQIATWAAQASALEKGALSGEPVSTPSARRKQSQQAYDNLWRKKLEERRAANPLQGPSPAEIPSLGHLADEPAPALEPPGGVRWATGDNIDEANLSSKKQQLDPENTIINIPIERFNEQLGDHFRLDLNDPLGGANAIGDRLPNAHAYFDSGRAMDPPNVGFNPATGEVTIGDGRHRLAAAYQRGETTAPVVVSVEDAPRVRGALGLPDVQQPATWVPPAPALGTLNPKAQLLDPKAIAAAQPAMKKAVAEGQTTGLLDLANTTRTDVPQTELPRYNPPRGVSQRLQDLLKDRKVLKGLREGIGRGVEGGAHNWYNTEPLRQAFIQELGANQGPVEFQRFMDYVAATSPRSDVLTNIRNASFYRFAEDEPGGLLDEGKPPKPYGHLAQGQHLRNVETVQGPGWDVIKNPKPASFVQNLIGNWLPGTMDTHAVRAAAMLSKDPRWLNTGIRIQKPGAPKGEWINYNPKKEFQEGRLSLKDALKDPTLWVEQPEPNEYRAMELLYRKLGAERDMSTAEAQAAGWVGQGELTGLGTKPKNFMDLFDEVLLRSAIARGEHPKDVLRKFIRKQAPLLGIGGAGAGLGLLSDDQGS